MKKIIFFTLAAVALLLSPEVFAQQGIGTNQPDRSAALDIVSTKRGLLIPRFGIPNLNDAAPVTNPANSLLVFNDGSEGTTAGFYWWRTTTNSWVPLTAEPGDPGDPTQVNINGINPIVVADLGDNNFEVSLDAGEDEGFVLVSEIDPVTNELVPVWKDPNDIFDQEPVAINAENGLTLIDDTIKLGGELTETTTIDFNGEDFIFQGITELTDLESEYKVIVMDENGALHFVDPLVFGGADPVQAQDLEVVGPLVFLDGNGEGAVLVPTTIGLAPSNNEGWVLTTVDDGDGGFMVDWAAPGEIETPNLGADNGLHLEGAEVYLGGSLIEPTVIETSEDNTLAIDGLQEAAVSNKIVVAEDAEGVLRTVTRSISANLSAGQDVSAINDYSPYVQEINIVFSIDALTADQNLYLPDASAAEGQMINIKLSGGDEADHYLSIRENGTEIAYGALPYQAWILKSNGTNWVIVGRN